MKKIVLCLLFSAFIGACLGLYSFVLFNREDNVTVSSMAKEVCAIQIGVFESLDNANTADGYHRPEQTSPAAYHQ